MTETLVQLLREGADKYEERAALLFRPGVRYQRWTYRQLWEESGRVASLLQQRGLNKGDRVLLWGPNCPQWVVAFFGCMRAGVLVVPLDMQSSQDFVDRVTDKTQPTLAFVSRMTPEHDRLQLSKVYFEELGDLIREMPPPQDVEATGSDLAEIMFTSGTTGNPKGVMITHANLISNVEASNQYIPSKPSYRLISILPLSHMFEQMASLLMTLRGGGNITYPTSRQPTVLFRTMRERKVTTMLLVPQALDLFMKGIEREVSRQGKERIWHLTMRIARYSPIPLRRLLFKRVHKQFGGSLRFIVSGGAALDPELGEKWSLLGIKIIQAYGTTEASPAISSHTLAKPRFDSVGQPLPGVEVKISEEGEVLVKGPNITPGYWEDPENTAAVFEDGWYKTGDQGYLDQQGYLHLQGRKKDMIVLPSGQNVFPDDIEAVLRKHTGVRDAVVVGLPKGSGIEVHAALLLEDPQAAPEVVSWTNHQLAEHQQIRGSTVWPEEDFPRTHTLKVKKGLVIDKLQGIAAAAPAAKQAPASGRSTGPRSLEHLVAEVGEVPLEQVTPEKALGLDLNLDSLGRVELLSAIETELGVYLDESLVSAGTTMAQLRDMLEKGSSVAAPSFPQWGMSLWCRVLRGALQRAIVFPLLALAYRLRVTGREELKDVTGPVLFAANHNLHLDNGLIIKAMPLKWRRRLTIAAAADMFEKPSWAIFSPLLGNAFPFSREGAIRASLENLGRILDEGWSVLIYPEGKMTVGGPIQPFMSGTGLVAVDTGVPVVPMRLHIHRMGSPWQFPLLPRGNVEIHFGAPLTFSPGTSYEEATKAIEEAVKAL